MISIEFDAPSFAVGKAIKGRIHVNSPIEGERLEIEKFLIALQRRTSLHLRRNGQWAPLWEQTKTPVTIEVKPNGSDMIPFEIPLATNLYYSSDGQTGNVRATFINTVMVVGVPTGPSSGNLETSAVVELTPREDPVPILDVHKHQFYKFCCFADGNVVLEVEIPNTVIDRERKAILVKVRTSKNTSGHKIKSVSAELKYGISYASSTFGMALYNPASMESSSNIDPDSEVTLPLVLTEKTGWQSLERDFETAPYILATLHVRFWFQGRDEAVVRSFDLNVI